MSALSRIQKQFPEVTRLVDSRKNLVITVEAKDTVSAKKKNPNQCALARACVREKAADGAIIGISTIWLVRGATATRFLTSQSLAREIVSFDRHHEFAPGENYTLCKVPASQCMGVDQRKRKRVTTGARANLPKRIVHRTANIRTLKGE